MEWKLLRNKFEITLDYQSGNIYRGEFSLLDSNQEIEYYIQATNISGDTASHPNAGWHLFTSLDYIVGDLNQDSSINIQDVILVVNLVLSNEYNPLSDINLDQNIDVLDIVSIVNIILS